MNGGSAFQEAQQVVAVAGVVDVGDHHRPHHDCAADGRSFRSAEKPAVVLKASAAKMKATTAALGGAKPAASNYVTHQQHEQDALSSAVTLNNEGVACYDGGQYTLAMQTLRRCLSRLDRCVGGCYSYEAGGIGGGPVPVSPVGAVTWGGEGAGVRNDLDLLPAATATAAVAASACAADLGGTASWDNSTCGCGPSSSETTKHHAAGVSVIAENDEADDQGQGPNKATKQPARHLWRCNPVTSLFSSSSSSKTVSPTGDKSGNGGGSRKHSRTTQRAKGRATMGTEEHHQRLSMHGLRADKASQYMYPQRNDYDEGMDCYPSGRRIEREDFCGADHSTVVATVLLNIGKIHRKRDDDLEEALRMYRKALGRVHNGNVHGDLLGTSSSKRENSSSGNTMDQTDSGHGRQCCPPLEVEILHCIGQVLYYQGEHGEALDSYTMAFGILSETGEETMTDVGNEEGYSSSIFLANTLNCIGVLQYHMSTGDSATDEILDNFREALQVRRAILGAEHPDVGTTLNNIGRFHFQRGDYDESMVAYGEALRIRRKVFSADNLDVAVSVFNTGQAHHQKGNYGEALALYEEFANVVRARLGRSHRDVAIATTCIAQIHHERKEYDVAMRLYNEALQIGKDALGEFHPEIAITYNKIGNLAYERGELDAAISAYQEGLRVERVVLDSGNSNIIVTLTNIAEIYKQKEEYGEAMERYNEALRLQKKNLGYNNAEVASTLNSIGMCFFHKEEYYEALDYYQEALRLRREKLGDDHVDVAATLTNIGLILLKRGMHEMAISVFLEALRIRRLNYGDVHRDVAFTMYNIAVIHHQRGDYEQALRCYNETMHLEKAALGNEHADVGITLYNRGQVQYQCGELDEALDSFQQALRLERKALGNEHPSVARTLNEIGNIHLQKGDIASVMQAFTEALRIYIKAGLSPDNLVVVGRNLYAYETAYPEAAGAA